MRVLPRLNEDVNEEWISDKARHACDGCGASVSTALCAQERQARSRRAGRSLCRHRRARECDKTCRAWPPSSAILAAAEEIKALKDLMARSASTNLDCRQDGAKLAAPRQSYLFNTTIAGVEAADALLLIGTNPRWEAPVLNARIRKTWLTAAQDRQCRTGLRSDLSGRAAWRERDVLLEAIAGRQPRFRESAEGRQAADADPRSGALARADGAAILKLAARSPATPA
jgi:NADH-quinone oxidoreductase subunit G